MYCAREGIRRVRAGGEMEARERRPAKGERALCARARGREDEAFVDTVAVASRDRGVYSGQGWTREG